LLLAGRTEVGGAMVARLTASSAWFSMVTVAVAVDQPASHPAAEVFAQPKRAALRNACRALATA
jgi:hypothetical protein